MTTEYSDIIKEALLAYIHTWTWFRNLKQATENERTLADRVIKDCENALHNLTTSSTPVVTQTKTRDWRLGRQVKSKYADSYNYVGTVEKVRPSGHKGINDPNGVLYVRLDGTGELLITGADLWVIA